MECVSFNSLPLSAIQPAYAAYEADTLVEPQVTRLAQLLFAAEEKRIRAALGRLAGYDDAGAQDELAAALALSPGYADASALRGMLALREMRFSEAADYFCTARRVEAKTGILIRRLSPTFRVLLRVSRFQFFPVYPDFYGVSMMLAVALWKVGKNEEALRVLRELANLVGWRDEMRVLAGEIYLAAGSFEAAQEVLSAGDHPSRDDLDLARHILRALAELALGAHHDAAITLKGDSAYVRERNPYLTTLVKFLYSHALEEDGLPVLALMESCSLRLKCVLNPELRNYILWREARLKKLLHSMTGEQLLKASEFRWMVAGEKITEQSVQEVMPPQPKVPRLMGASPPRTDHERMRRLDELFHKAREDAAKADADEAEAREQKAAPVPEFDPSRKYDWSISQSGDREICYYDYRGMRDPPEALTAGEKRLKQIEEIAIIGGGIVLLLFFIRACF